MSAAPPLPELRGEIESPRPLRARHGIVVLEGWCLAADGRAPAVRVVTAAGTIVAPPERRARPDLGGVACGFSMRGPLPSGVHLARFEAQSPDGSWRAFRTHTLRVDPAPLAAAIEWPLREGTLVERLRVAGWAVHPEQPIEQVTVRFGHQDLRCKFGEARADVAALFPDRPRAAASGFITEEMSPAGHGPLRIRARLANGTTAIASTPVRVAVAQDENHPASLDLGAPRLALPRPATARAAAPVERAAVSLNVLFLLPGNFAANNALHAAALANELAAAGHQPAIAVTRDPETARLHAGASFAALTHAEAPRYRFPDGRGPDVVHAWTTRESVRALAEALATTQRCRLVVHLEDNEQHLLAQTLGRSIADLEALPDEELDRLVPPTLSHPRRSRAFLARADGLTLITPRLRELAPVAARCLTLWPAADARYFQPQPLPAEFRRLLDVTPGTTVIFYHGNVHASNAAEVRELYAALARLNESGTPVTLIRTGTDEVDFLGAHAARARAHVLELGAIAAHRHLPALMALADLFVQPGAPDAFNDYRFPSKLPEFFALGRPVILPRTNLGEKVRHGVDAYVLDRADAAGIARAVRELRADPALAARLAAGAVQFAEQHFSWRRSAEALAKFYAALAPS